MSAPVLTVCDAEVFERPVRLRLPFRFGDAEVHQTAEAYLRLTVEIAGERVTGHAAQLMVPRWFDKRADLDNAATVEELRDSIRATLRAAPGASGTLATIGRSLREQVQDAMPADTPALAAGFGCALLEMAAVDAVCRAANLPFHAAAQRDLFGVVGTGDATLPAATIREALSTLAPVWSVDIRHTVGYGSPLIPTDLHDPGSDNPIALWDVIERWGVRFLKIKLKGDPQTDIAWLVQVADVLAGFDRRFRVTLDANEQYRQDAFYSFLDAFRAEGSLARLRGGLLYIEQPFDRAVSLATDGPEPPADVPIIIDEADDSDDAFPRALKRGWSGTSVKSCKGVLRALRNFAVARNATAAGRQAIIASEDLTCQPGLCWQQDTLMAAALGLTHSERNGHYFAGGMQGAPDAEISRYINRHADIYRPGPNGPVLDIVDGRANFQSLNAPGFGSDPGPDLGAATPISL